MFIRCLPVVFGLAVFANTSAARADEQPAHAQPSHSKQTTGIVLTSVGGSMLVSAPLVFVAGIAYAQANPYSFAAAGPVMLGAIGGGAIGLGLLIPGIVMLTTCRPSKERAVPMPETKQPAWTDTRPIASGTRAFTIPLFRGTF